MRHLKLIADTEFHAYLLDPEIEKTTLCFFALIIQTYRVGSVNAMVMVQIIWNDPDKYGQIVYGYVITCPIKCGMKLLTHYQYYDDILVA